MVSSRTADLVSQWQKSYHVDLDTVDETFMPEKSTAPDHKHKGILAKFVEYLKRFIHTGVLRKDRQCIKLLEKEIHQLEAIGEQLELTDLEKVVQRIDDLYAHLTEIDDQSDLNSQLHQLRALHQIAHPETLTDDDPSTTDVTEDVDDEPTTLTEPSEAEETDPSEDEELARLLDVQPDEAPQPSAHWTPKRIDRYAETGFMLVGGVLGAAVSLFVVDRITRWDDFRNDTADNMYRMASEDVGRLDGVITTIPANPLRDDPLCADLAQDYGWNTGNWTEGFARDGLDADFARENIEYCTETIPTVRTYFTERHQQAQELAEAHAPDQSLRGVTRSILQAFATETMTTFNWIAPAHWMAVGGGGTLGAYAGRKLYRGLKSGLVTVAEKVGIAHIYGKTEVKTDVQPTSLEAEEV